MKNRRNLISAALVGLLATTLLFPFVIAPASAQQEQSQVSATWRSDGNWNYIQNDVITIMFPAGGKKPMFLWWYTKDPNNIYVIKYKGLIEYVTFDQPYFMIRSEAEPARIKEMMQNQFYEPKRHTMQLQKQLAVEKILGDIENLGLHRPFLPFSGATWELSTPMNVTEGDVRYLSFNFTLVDVPSNWPKLQFAENNIIIRCRFYYTPATEDVEGRYSYTVAAGEFKMDLVIKHWEWNIDKLKDLLQRLGNELGIDIPQGKAGLALWINMASINLTKLPIAESDAQSASDTGLEMTSMAQNMYVEGQKVQVSQNMTSQDAQPMLDQMRERFKFRFEKGEATLAGFFKFVPKALIRNSTDNSVVGDVNVTASYVAAGGHMRVFICYPYFNNYTLEHDPSLGLESLPAVVSYELAFALLGVAAIIAVSILVIRRKKGPVNMLKPN